MKLLLAGLLFSDAAGADGGECIVQPQQSLPPCTPQNPNLACFDYGNVGDPHFYRCCGGLWFQEPTDAGYQCPPIPDSGTD